MITSYLSNVLNQDIAQEAVKKRRRATKKPYSRAIVGATLEVIQKKRSEKPEVRDAAREAALRYHLFFFFHLLSIFYDDVFDLKVKKYVMILVEIAVKLRRGLRKLKMRRRQRKQRWCQSKRVKERQVAMPQKARGLNLEVVVESVKSIWYLFTRYFYYYYMLDKILSVMYLFLRCF